MAEECKKLPANTPSKKRGHRIRSWSSYVLPGLLPTRVLDCVLRYRKGTRTLSLIFGGTRPPSLVGYSNADCRSRAVSGYGYSLDQLVLSNTTTRRRLNLLRGIHCFLQPFGTMTTQQYHPRLPNVKFRVLIIGRANAGKTTILQRVCDTTESPEIYRLDQWGRRNRVHSYS